MGGNEIRDLWRLKREEIEGRHVFVTERRAPISTAGFRKMLARRGEKRRISASGASAYAAARCGYKLANDEQDKPGRCSIAKFTITLLK